jgi:hypothetical protein
MWSLKALYKWFTSVALLAAIVSFYGVSPGMSNFQKTQTELVDNAKSFKTTSDFHYNQLSNYSEKQAYNQYIVFNFKCFLVKHQFDFNITFKSQKGKILLFENYNTLLEKNLIAQLYYNNLQDLL